MYKMPHPDRARGFSGHGIIEDGNRREMATTLVRVLRSKGLIDGVGIQGHWSVTAPVEESARHDEHHRPRKAFWSIAKW